MLIVPASTDRIVRQQKGQQMEWEPGYDRRKHRRVTLRLVVDYQDPELAGGGQTTCLETLNFSAGGFYCCLDRKMPPLTRLALCFVFPPFGPNHDMEHNVNCEAVVVRCEPEQGDSKSYRVGACFTDLTPEDRIYIQEYLEWFDTVYNDSEEPEAEWESESDEEVA